MVGALEITWLGHATTLLEFDDTRLLTDPVLSGRVGPLVRLAPRVKFDALGRIDAVLLSHLHADHVEPHTLRRLERSALVLAPRGARRWLRRHGVEEVHELEAGDTVSVNGLSLTATPAVHSGRRQPFGPSAEPIGYAVRGARSAYFAGDTALFSAMSELRGTVEVALLPISGWGPTLGPGHLDPETAALALKMIAPKVAVPIHWGTFALGRPARRPTDPARPAREFIGLARRHAPEVDVRALTPGETTRL